MQPDCQYRQLRTVGPQQHTTPARAAGRLVLRDSGSCRGLPRAAWDSRRCHQGRAASVLAVTAEAGKGFGPQTKPPKKPRDPQPQEPRPALSPRPTRQPAPAAPPDPADSDEEVPELIYNRILSRILKFSGVPVLTGLLLFPCFYYLKVVQKLDLPTWVVYIAQVGAFGGGLLGITYGILSASWDPMREGSRLGWTEFRANLPLIIGRVRERGGKGRV